MRHKCLRYSLALLFASFLPLGCADEPASPQGTGGSGGSANGGSGGHSGGKGGSGGSQPGGAGGSGGAASGGSGGQAGRDAGGQPSGGSGGQATGGGGGTSVRDGSSDNRIDARDGEPDLEDGGSSDAMGDEVGGGATCDDKKQNGNETDTDCGGGECPKCGAAQKCQGDVDCKSGKCTSNKCDDPFAATATVAQTDNKNVWKITMGTLTLEVDSTQAARIVTYSTDGTDVLVDNMGDSTGSVFWPAPQSDWNENGWPPPDEFQTKAYTASNKDNVLTMTGPAGTTGISVIKRFWGNTEHLAVTIEYTIKNGGSSQVKMAPWEITRVYPGGLTFFPNSEPPVLLGMQYSGFKEVPFTATTGGALWWKYKSTEFSSNVKSGADGLEGWAAHVMCGTGLEKTCSKSPVLIKQWADQSSPAPSEREVEIYADAGHQYVEFEQLGAYQSIPAGGSITWTMHWMLRYLPSTVTPTVGNQELLDWVRGQLL